MGTKRRQPYQYKRPSNNTELRVSVGQLIKCKGKKYIVAPEARENGLQMGCWGCAFNMAPKREDFVIPPCKCSLKNDFTPVEVYITKRNRELVYTCHDLFLACTGKQSVIYIKK